MLWEAVEGRKCPIHGIPCAKDMALMSGFRRTGRRIWGREIPFTFLAILAVVLISALGYFGGVVVSVNRNEQV